MTNSTPKDTPTTNPSSSSSPRLGNSLFGPNGYFGQFSDNQRNYRLQECMELQRALEDCERLHMKLNTQGNKKISKVANETGNINDTSDKISTWKNLLSRMRKKTENDYTIPREEEANDPPLSASPKIEETRSGMKMSRFFNWDLTNPNAAKAISAMRKEGSDGTLRKMHPSTVSNTTKDSVKTQPNVSEKRNSQQQLPKSCSRERHAVWGCRAMAVGCASDLVELKKCFRDKLKTNNPQDFYYDKSDNNVSNLNNDNNEQGIKDRNTIVDCQMEQKMMMDCVVKNEKELKERLSKSH